MNLSFVVVGFICLVLVLMLPPFLMSKDPYKYKASAYECGFLPLSKSSSSVSLQFYVLMIIFLLFDLEVVLLVTFLVTLSPWFLLVLIFMIGSLWMEWKLNKTNWANSDCSMS